MEIKGGKERMGRKKRMRSSAGNDGESTREAGEAERKGTNSDTPRYQDLSGRDVLAMGFGDLLDIRVRREV
jgi:hypothetical protein